MRLSTPGDVAGRMGATSVVARDRVLGGDDPNPRLVGVGRGGDLVREPHQAPSHHGGRQPEIPDHAAPAGHGSGGGVPCSLLDHCALCIPHSCAGPG